MYNNNFNYKFGYLVIVQILLILVVAMSFFKVDKLSRKIEDLYNKLVATEQKLSTDIKAEKDKNMIEQNEIEKFKMMLLETKKLAQDNQRPQIANIVKSWRPYSVYIICSWGDPEDRFASGSGKITKIAGEDGIYILTNRHVLINGNEKPTECFVTFPDISKLYVLEKPNVKSLNNDLDVAYLEMQNTDEKVEKLAKQADLQRICSGDVQVGNSVVALGYPSIGTSGDITATEGIISGFDGESYISSVKIDHGNSGGLAILVKNNCYLGITTSAVTGEIESLARILKYSAISPSQP